MKSFQIVGVAAVLGLMIWGATALEAQNPKLKERSVEAALDKLMGVVGEQIDTAGRELKSFVRKAEGEMIESGINAGIDRITGRLEATPDQVTKIRPILRKDVETTGEILDEALSVGLAAARASLTRSLNREWRNVRADLSKTLSTKQLSIADELHADRTAQLAALFDPLEEKKEQ